MPTINGKRLLADLRYLRTMGARGNGVVRPSLSDIDLRSRHWLVARMTEAGLEARIDGVGNVMGCSRNGGSGVLIGSHTDTQPTGGWLDGALGVIYALEVARALAENERTQNLVVDVASWVDEEGTYLGMLGSQSFCGMLSEDAISQAKNHNGHPLSAALDEAGLSGVSQARMDAGRYVGYLEAHIEQGPFLESSGKRIGVVTGIVGMRDHEVRFSGQQNHAGTTPMNLRKDAGAALIRFAMRVETEFRKLAGERTVWTIGQVRFEPGARSIIPGEASMNLQFRDPEAARVDALAKQVEDLVQEMNGDGGVEVLLGLVDKSAAAVKMDENLQHHLAMAAQQHAPDAWMRMPSGAGHDAQILAQQIPAGMLFVPSIGGVSHDFAEDTSPEDIVLGCQVLADAVVSVLGSQ